MAVPQTLLDVRPEVAAALGDNRPVVAFGSAALSHSLPWPTNLETIGLVRTAVQEEKATLAVLAVWQGRLTVGLAANEIEALARGASTLRATRRDLVTAVVQGRTAATTVAANMYIARLAGIRLVATGALGGAARGDDQPWQLSADLRELGRNPVAVVSAGARSVLKLAITSEILESFGVPVVGYQTDSFLPFYLSKGGVPASARADTPAEAATLLTTHWAMEGAGVVVAQPTPADVALSPDELHSALLEVEKQASHAHVRSRDLPPFLMTRLNRLTRGKALRAYQAILVANARLAAQIARELVNQPQPKVQS
jgi:pseudouridine-5'-phosphate glycosidase